MGHLSHTCRCRARRLGEGGAAARVGRERVACAEVVRLMTDVYGNAILRIKNPVNSYTVGRVCWRLSDWRIASGSDGFQDE